MKRPTIYRRPEDLFTPPSPEDRWAAARARLAQFCSTTARAARGEPPTKLEGAALEAQFGGR